MSKMLDDDLLLQDDDAETKKLLVVQAMKQKECTEERLILEPEGAGCYLT